MQSSQYKYKSCRWLKSHPGPEAEELQWGSPRTHHAAELAKAKEDMKSRDAKVRPTALSYRPYFPVLTTAFFFFLIFNLLGQVKPARERARRRSGDVRFYRMVFYV